MTCESVNEYIDSYEGYIRLGNGLLQKKYKFGGSPLLQKRSGKIPASGQFSYEAQEFKFKFHGIGCRFEFGKIIVEFDFTFGDFEYKGFEVNKLNWFINSTSDEQLSNKDLIELLMQLKSEGIIRKNGNELNTHDFEKTPPSGLSVSLRQEV